MRASSWRLLVVAAVVCAACSGSKSGGTAPPAGPPIDLSVKGADVLGKGTDVFGAYAVEENVKGQLLDLPALNSAGYLVYSANVEESRYEEAAGRTVADYTSRLAVNVGLSGEYKVFAAEVKANYTEAYARRDDYSFASIIERHWKHAVRVAPGVWGSGAHLRPYLTTLARRAIDDDDPVKRWSGAEVIAAYGTHVMNGVYVGGRLDYHLAIQILSAAHESSLSAYAKFNYKSLFASAELTAGLDAGVRTAMDAYNRYGPVINAKGGDAQYANPASDAQYALWKASLDTNPVFCGIIQGGLLGIWELAPTPARRQELLDAFEAYARTQDASLVPLVQRITGLTVVNAGQGTSVTPPPGYALITSLANETVGGSLNKGIVNDTVGADNVYLAYKAEVTEDPIGIAGVHVATSDPDTDVLFFGPGGHAGAFDPGSCTTASSVNLNAGTCGSANIWEEWGCSIWGWVGGCAAPGTPLYLHVEPELASTPIRCVVVGDAVAVDLNQAPDVRAAHIYWGPRDANRDGRTPGIEDARWVLDHVRWLVRTGTDTLVNLNQGVQSFQRYDWWGGCNDMWDDAWWHALSDPVDAQYLGVCYPEP
jgi:hypothetical protein